MCQPSVAFGGCLTKHRYPTLRPQPLHYLAITPFAIPLILAVSVTLYVIIVFEMNARRAALPENEAYTEIGQWGPYVTASLVLIATLIAKWKGWDFDNEGSSGFQWLLNRSESKAQIGDAQGGQWGRDSQESLLRKGTELPFLELGWRDQSLGLEGLERRELKRSRSF